MNKSIPLALALLVTASGGLMATGPVAQASSSEVSVMKWYRARARMQSEGDMKGKTDYRERERRGALEQRIQVHVQRAQADTEYEVFLNDTSIGFLTTSSDGEGKLYMRTRNPHGRWQAMPEDFPTILTGDMITVGEAVGVFHSRD